MSHIPEKDATPLAETVSALAVRLARIESIGPLRFELPGALLRVAAGDRFRPEHIEELISAARGDPKVLLAARETIVSEDHRLGEKASDMLNVAATRAALDA